MGGDKGREMVSVDGKYWYRATNGDTESVPQPALGILQRDAEREGEQILVGGGARMAA